jgi:catechol 2,3-dioxygenase-like lactoylglutathione lyase family enzyme
MAGAAHVCLEVRDIEATARELSAAGATMQGEVADVTSGVAAGGRAAYMRDPNGIIIELYEPPGVRPPAGGLQGGKPRI